MIGAASITDLFRLVRCKVRYGNTLMINDPAMDKQAEIANTDQDKMMINCIEDCSLKVGYFILRALAAVREYGSPKAKSMGLYAILCSNEHLQDFISLVNFMYIDSKLYLRLKHSAKVVFKQQNQLEHQLLHRFSKLAVAFPCDLSNAETTTPYNILAVQPRIAEQAYANYDYELMAEQKQFADFNHYGPMIRYARMQKQSIHNNGNNESPSTLLGMAAKENTVPSDTPKTAEQVAIDKAAHARAVKEKAAHANQHLVRMLLLLVPGDELRVDGALGEGTGLYRAAYEILQECATALKLPGGHTTWTVMQSNFIRRVKFMEATMLRFCLETICQSHLC